MSKTFCPLPWTHLATHPQGELTLCCEADHTQGISESFDTDEFKKTIFEIFENYENYNEKIKNLEKITKKNTWNNLNKKIIEIIDEN